MASDRENAKMLARLKQMDVQIFSIKQERDRLLEISSDLKIQLSRSEKKKHMLSSAGP